MYDAVAATSTENMTTRDAMRIITRTVLLCTDVAEGAGTKGYHKERDLLKVLRKMFFLLFTSGGASSKSVRVL